ncbi:hypothetical protein J6590_091150 [Homalodisca vitripennis]|nr:hypothetical protein J6590_091150 [Homalodisca vitripennis]
MGGSRGHCRKCSGRGYSPVATACIAGSVVGGSRGHCWKCSGRGYSPVATACIAGSVVGEAIYRWKQRALREMYWVRLFIGGSRGHCGKCNTTQHQKTPPTTKQPKPPNKTHPHHQNTHNTTKTHPQNNQALRMMGEAIHRGTAALKQHTPKHPHHKTTKHQKTQGTAGSVVDSSRGHCRKCSGRGYSLVAIAGTVGSVVCDSIHWCLNGHCGKCNGRGYSPVATACTSGSVMAWGTALSVVGMAIHPWLQRALRGHCRKCSGRGYSLVALAGTVGSEVGDSIYQCLQRALREMQWVRLFNVGPSGHFGECNG